MRQALTIALSAGEASGDQLAAQLVQQLRQRLPQAKFYGIGGTHMAAAGVELVADYKPLAVMGYWDVLLALPKIIGVRRRFIQRTDADKPDIFIGIDAPDFNLPLARRLREKGSRCMQYVVPSVWMWRRQRLRKISAAVEAVLCLLPFEKPLYENFGVRAYYVGHPAVHRLLPDRAAARARLGIALEAQVIALFPGSRQSELTRHLPVLQQAVHRLSQADASRRFVVASNPEMAPQIEQSLPQTVRGELAEVLAAADIAIVKSGTIALETALAQVPLLVFYRLSRPARWFVRWRTFYLPYFSLPNIISRRFIATELILDEANAGNIARESERLLTDRAYYEKQRRRLAAMRELLMSAPLTAADAVMDFITKNKP